MKNVIWNGAAAGSARVLRVKDLDALDIKHKDEDLVWNQANNFTLEMSNQMSDSLVEKLPGEFRVTEGTDEVPEIQDPMTSFAASSTGSDEGSPDESSASGDDDQRASTRKRRRES
jgi:hypothetical protein